MQEFRARVLGLVHAVAKAGELVLLRDRLLDERGNVVGRGDLLEHLHRPVGRAAVERPLQRAEGRGHRGVEVRVRRRGHPRDERRRVQPVLGLEDEARVQHRRRARVLLLGPGHLGEVLGVPERRVRRDRLLALPPADVAREDRRHLRHEAQRLRVLGLGRVVALRRVLEARRAHDRAEHIHRRGVLARLLQDVPQERRERPLLRELGLEVAQLPAVGEVAVQEEVGDLLVLGLGLQDVVDRVAAVGELGVLDEADIGLDRDDALEAGDPGGGLLLHRRSIRARALSRRGPLGL